MWRFLVPVLVLAVLVAFFFRGLFLNPGELPSPLIGQPAPVFSLPQLENPQASLTTDDILGEVSLVNVWGSWCPPCWQEHPFLMELAREGDVPIYGLNYRDTHDGATAFLRQLGDPYAAVGFDGDGRVGIDWGVYGAPETFLLDADGTVLHKHINPLTPTIWQRDFMPLIREARARQSAKDEVK
jgi:cytochrome c biogenesis protein CcmG, thiol:disulfide interchange protein DsbE